MRRNSCGSRSRICFPAASRSSRASAPIPPCCCIWPRKSTRLRRSSSSIRCSCFPRRSPIATISSTRLGLTNVITVTPEPRALAEEDPEKFLWARDPDRCCQIRKVLPLAKALDGYDAWITGRKRFQAATRSALPLFESEGDRGENQSARRLDAGTTSKPISTRMTCRAMRWSNRTIFQSAVFHAPRR